MVKWVSQMMTTKSAGVQAMGKDTGVAIFVIFMATWSDPLGRQATASNEFTLEHLKIF